MTISTERQIAEKKAAEDREKAIRRGLINTSPTQKASLGIADTPFALDSPFPPGTGKAHVAELARKNFMGELETVKDPSQEKAAVSLCKGLSKSIY